MRAGYPLAYRAIRARVLKRDGYRCTVCGAHEGQYGWRTIEGEWVPVEAGEPVPPDIHPIQVEMVLAFKNYDRADVEPENLVTMCRACRLRHDLHRDGAMRAATNFMSARGGYLPLDGA